MVAFALIGNLRPTGTRGVLLKSNVLLTHSHAEICGFNVAGHRRLIVTSVNPKGKKKFFVNPSQNREILVLIVPDHPFSLVTAMHVRQDKLESCFPFAICP